MRFLLGPWRWMLLVYVVLDEGARTPRATGQSGPSGT
jgi:hypothetical protein